MSTEDPDDAWPPRVGRALPRAADAYSDPKKLPWILSDEGHGGEWARVLHIGPDEGMSFWDAIAEAVTDSAISSIRDIHPYGVNCEAHVEIAVRDRVTQASTV
jgi:hypothetical protein